MSDISYFKRVQIVQKIVEDDLSIRGEAKKLGIDKNVLKFWIKCYSFNGKEGLKLEKRKFSVQEKREVVKYYLTNDVSLVECAARFKMKTPSTLRVWIKMYEHECDVL